MFKLINAVKRSEGLTLVEMMIALGVIMIGAMGGYTLLANIHGTRAGNVEVVQAQQDARNLVERIARELRESSPEVVWLSEGESDYISFLTPRDNERRFMVDADGKPVWQRGVAYSLDRYSHELHRYQGYLVYDPEEGGGTYDFEVAAKNVETLFFSRSNDLITIAVRTFTEHEGEVGHVARSYADFRTTVKMRN